MDASTLVVRPASEDDRAVLEDLIADCYATVYPGWYEEDTLSEALPPGATPNSEFTGHIRHFATRPDAMGKGIGGAILERCVAEAAASGMQKLKCFSSLAAEGFYARHGFAKIDTVSVMLGSGAYFPAVLMERAL